MLACPNIVWTPEPPSDGNPKWSFSGWLARTAWVMAALGAAACSSAQITEQDTWTYAAALDLESAGCRPHAAYMAKSAARLLDKPFPSATDYDRAYLMMNEARRSC